MMRGGSRERPSSQTAATSKTSLGEHQKEACNRPGRPGSDIFRIIISLGGTMTDSYPFTVFGGEFKGKRVLVTGGTKGIGEAIARRFALGAASVATTARSEAVNGQDSFLFIKADIGTARGIQNVVDCIQREWGGLDILVNNVGG